MKIKPSRSKYKLFKVSTLDGKILYVNKDYSKPAGSIHSFVSKMTHGLEIYTDYWILAKNERQARKEYKKYTTRKYK